MLVEQTVATPPIRKALPGRWFIVHGSNAEMRWEAMRDQGYLTPNERFFVRNHTRTPDIEPATWRLQVRGPACAATWSSPTATSRRSRSMTCNR
jgi:hypothetical protein